MKGEGEMRICRYIGGLMGNRGKSGCGCLIFCLVLCMICAGLLIHPYSLRLIAKQLRYEDKIIPADVVFVPRFVEDRNGETYVDAFREYWAGNAKAIYAEEDKVFGVSMQELLARAAKAKGIKEAVVKSISAEGEDSGKYYKIRGKLRAMGYKKVIVLVPEYASRRFHLIFSKGDDKTLFMIKPVEVSSFKRDKWWKDSSSRLIFLKEVYELGFTYYDTLTGDGKKP